MLGMQKLSIFPGKGGCSNNLMVRIIRVITVVNHEYPVSLVCMECGEIAVHCMSACTT